MPRSPLTAFVGIACSLAGLGSLWFGRSAVLVAACLAAAGIALSVSGWRSARSTSAPVGLALAGLLVGGATAGIVVVLTF